MLQDCTVAGSIDARPHYTAADTSQRRSRRRGVHLHRVALVVVSAQPHRDAYRQKSLNRWGDNSV